jgi:hypothetical protein
VASMDARKLGSGVSREAMVATNAHGREHKSMKLPTCQTFHEYNVLYIESTLYKVHCIFSLSFFPFFPSFLFLIFTFSLCLLVLVLFSVGFHI